MSERIGLSKPGGCLGAPADRHPESAERDRERSGPAAATFSAERRVCRSAEGLRDSAHQKRQRMVAAGGTDSGRGIPGDLEQRRQSRSGAVPPQRRSQRSGDRGKHQPGGLPGEAGSDPRSLARKGRRAPPQGARGPIERTEIEGSVSPVGCSPQAKAT